MFGVFNDLLELNFNKEDLKKLNSLFDSYIFGMMLAMIGKPLLFEAQYIATGEKFISLAWFFMCVGLFKSIIFVGKKGLQICGLMK